MDEWERRKFIALQALLIILDFPALICALILVLSWRSKNFISRIKQVKISFFPPKFYKATISDNKTKIIFSEFWELMVDTPYVILGVFTLWRIPFLLHKMFTEGETAYERRRMVPSYLVAMLKDIPCLFLLIIMAVTVWRVPSLRRKYLKVIKLLNCD